MTDSRNNSSVDERNRRRHPRRPCRIRAWADPGGAAPVVDCVVLDISEGGANVMSLNGNLPDTFDLQVDQHMKMGRAEVAWRDGASAGVRLEKPKLK